MERRKHRALKLKKEPKLSLKSSLLLGLFTFAFILSACQAIPAATNNDVSPPPQGSSHQIETVIVSDVNIINPGVVIINPVQSETLGAELDFLGIPTTIESPSKPCGDPGQPIISEVDNDHILVHERRLLCDNLSILSIIFRWDLSDVQIEELASKIIILDQENRKRYCLGDANGCEFSSAGFLALEPSSSITTLIHELGHNPSTQISPYYSASTGFCYQSAGESFSITYPDNDQLTGVSTITASPEFLSTTFEQFAISLGLRINNVTGFQSDLPGYLQFTNPNDTDAYIYLIGAFYRFGEGFKNIQPNTNNAGMIQEQPSLEDIAKLLEQVSIASGVDLVDLIDRLNSHLFNVSPLRHSYIPPLPVVEQPIDACQP